MGLLRSLFMGWLGICAALAAADPVADTTYYNIWDEPDGRRFSFDTPAHITFPKGSPNARVEYQVTVGEQKQWMKAELAIQDLRAAQKYLARQRVGLKVPNGGVLAAKPERIVILNLNHELQVGLEVITDDFVPSDNLDRKLAAMRSVQPLSAIADLDQIDPLSTPLMTQQYLVGVAPVGWKNSSPPPATWPSVPVVVIQMKVLQDGSHALMVVEKRELLDSRVRALTAYLIPPHRLRVPSSQREYDQAVANLEDEALDRKRGLFRQTALFPWTHSVIALKHEDAPTLETDDQRFVRRAEILLEWMAAQPETEDNEHAHRPNCADYLYNESLNGPEY